MAILLILPIFFILLVLFIVALVFFILFLINILDKEENKKYNIVQSPTTTSSNNNYINKEYLKYTTNHYVMTYTELQFYKKLKNYITENNLCYEIFPQVDLERMIKVVDNNISDRNKIKSRSIDFTIVSKNDCKILFCIELDDYTHKRNDRIDRDRFINGLFNKVGIILYRIYVKDDYINDFNSIFKKENGEI